MKESEGKFQCRNPVKVTMDLFWFSGTSATDQSSRFYYGVGFHQTLILPGKKNSDFCSVSMAKRKSLKQRRLRRNREVPY